MRERGRVRGFHSRAGRLNWVKQSKDIVETYQVLREPKETVYVCIYKFYVGAFG